MPGQGRLGDKAKVSADAHGCPGCPHPGIGPAIMGSPDVFVNGSPALRVDDVGIHAVCCGTNMWQAQQGSATVFINGKAAFRLNDPSKHCGGSGQLIEGSSDVIVGDGTSAGGGGASGGAAGSSSGGGGGGGASSTNDAGASGASSNSGAQTSTTQPATAPAQNASEASAVDQAQAETLKTASKRGSAFCAECAAAARVASK